MNQMFRNNPPISVLMSVYNGEKWLNESIQSVLSQTFSDFEFIIVNDGSTDSSPEIINSFAVHDDRIVIINKPNTGLADSLNRGIAEAKGEWIARIDADDICEPNRLQKQFDFARTVPDVVLIGSGMIVIDESGHIVKKYSYPQKHEALVRRLRLMKAFFSHSSAFYKTEVVRRVGGYRPRLKRAQDWDLWLRLSERGKIACINEYLVKVRKHDDQVSHEEGGKRQLIDSFVASTSYWLRQMGHTDPVEPDCPDSEFYRFREWVKRQLNINNIFAYQDFLRNLRKEFFIHGKTLHGFARIGFIASASPLYVIKYVSERIFGNRLAMRMAYQWIKFVNNLKP